MSIPYRIKICGIRTKKDVDIVLKAQPDAIGFIVGAKHVTEDEVSPEFVKSVIVDIPNHITPVLVTHLVKSSEILNLADKCQINCIQLHSEITVKEIETIIKKAPYLTLIKAFHANIPNSISLIPEYKHLISAIILDTASNGRVGGTGKTHDWKVSYKIVKSSHLPIILAGGLTPDNVKFAILQVNPYAVDVNSGVEDENGNKDLNKIRSFISNAQQSFANINRQKYAFK